MNYYEVLVKNVPQLLTYQAKAEIPIGSLIEVRLGTRSANGVIIKKVAMPEYDCVAISEVHIEAAISPLQLQLCRWMSSYYFASLQRCVQLFIPSVIWNQKIQAKYEQFLELKISLEKALEQTKRAPKQQELIKKFEQKNKISKTELKEHGSPALVRTLIKKELLNESIGELLNPDISHPSKPHHDQPLTSEQQKVLDSIMGSENRKQRSLRGSPFLLHGITGSGKTEVYLQLIKKSIQEGKQTVLLVPEIALTTELIQHFSEQFPAEISIIHSKLSEQAKVQAWHRIHQGKSKLILGSRSALFTPWKNLGTIIVDEEHEWTYKQESSPRYHVKTVCEQISDLSKSKPELILGSATPSLESFHQASQSTDNSQLLTMLHRANKSSLPPVSVVDLRQEFQKKNFSMFSDLLQEKIHERMEKGEQVILFLNKRGSSSSITCRDCGYSPKCTDCDICMTYHARLRDFQEGGLLCHYCGSFADNPTACPNCQSAAIRHLGTGTQKAEAQLQELFPDARILRADRDTTGGKYDFEEIYHQMRRGEADMLIGTQMIAKGLDLPNITLTGVLLADIGLHLPDFRASERVFQLLTQVAGRSGRHKPGEVVIQTYQPDHPAIQAAKEHDYNAFYEGEIAIREQFLYSPFSRSIKLIYAHENPKQAADEALQIYGKLNDLNQDHKLEMAPHYIPKLHGKFIWNILIRGQEPRELIKQISLPRGWKIDVDPR